MIVNSYRRLIVILVSYNSFKYIEDCLRSLYEYPPEDSFEVIVVDNCSTDATVPLIKEKWSRVRLIENEKNLGFAKANNIAIRSSDSKYILLLNSDCQVFKDSLNSMIDLMDKRKDTGISGPKIINSDGTVQLSCRRFPNFIDAGMHTLLSPIIPDNPFSRRYKLSGIKRDRSFEVDWVSGSCMMIRRDSLKDTGLLDERFFMYVEDTDICYRMWKQGWKVVYNPGSEILHHTGGSTGKGRLKEVRSSIRMQKSAFYFFWKNYKRTWKILLLPVIGLVLGLRILFTFIKNLLK